MTQTPIGIVWRKEYVRMCSDCFDKPFLIERMKASSNNIKPVIVIDTTTKKAKCYIINSIMTDFEEITEDNKVLCRKIETIANYMINKKNIQKSNLSVDEKEVSCKINELKHYRKTELIEGIQKKLDEHLKKVGLVESK